MANPLKVIENIIKESDEREVPLCFDMVCFAMARVVRLRLLEKSIICGSFSMQSSDWEPCLDIRPRYRAISGRGGEVN